MDASSWLDCEVPMNRLVLLVSAVAAGFLAAVFFQHLDHLRGVVDRRAEQATLAYAVVLGMLVALSMVRFVPLAAAWGFLFGSGAAAGAFLVAATCGLPLNPATAIFLVTSCGLAGAVYGAHRSSVIARRSPSRSTSPPRAKA